MLHQESARSPKSPAHCAVCHNQIFGQCGKMPVADHRFCFGQGNWKWSARAASIALLAAHLISFGNYPLRNYPPHGPLSLWTGPPVLVRVA